MEGRNSLPKYLEKEELKHFLHIAKKLGLDQDYPIFLLMAYTGIRAVELCALKWRDINLQNRLLAFQKHITIPQTTEKNTSYQLQKHLQRYVLLILMTL